MPDPLASIAEESQSLTGVGEDGEAIGEAQGPGVGDRVLELFKPCPEDPLSKAGMLSRGINGFLARRADLKPEEITVGENVVHCIDHLFPGGGMGGWPPIVNLALSVMDYRGKVKRNPDNGKLVRP